MKLLVKTPNKLSTGSNVDLLTNPKEAFELLGKLEKNLKVLLWRDKTDFLWHWSIFLYKYCWQTKFRIMNDINESLAIIFTNFHLKYKLP